jgi:endonuclease/exonuclease/phosphatase family metal-dependent hydrolase
VRAMKVATFNVNGIGSRLPLLLQWLDTASPDVVCLQELKAEHNRFPAAAIATAGYRAGGGCDVADQAADGPQVGRSVGALHQGFAHDH